MRVRAASEADTAALARIFFDAVHIGAARAYAPAERDAWCRRSPPVSDWARRLSGLAVRVACDPAPVGFAALRDDGYVDLLFADPRWRGAGVGDALLRDLCTLARDRGHARLTTHASHLAKPAFLRHGWQVSGPDSMERDGVTITRWSLWADLTRSRAMSHTA